MNDRVLTLLPDYVLGGLSEAERAEVDAALAESPALRAEAAGLADTFALIGLDLEPVAPAPAVKARLMASIGKDRFAPFVAALARYFDLAKEKVEVMVRSLDDALTRWEPGPLPGLQLIHVTGGPATVGADVGFVRFDAGLHFPWHRHHGAEVNFVLEGSLRDHDGRVYGPGEALEKAAGSEHEFFIGAEGALVAVVVHEGFEILPYGPGLARTPPGHGS